MNRLIAGCIVGLCFAAYAEPFERCYLESGGGSIRSCFLPRYNITLSCTGSLCTDSRYAPVSCTFNLSPRPELDEISCDIATPAPITAGEQPMTVVISSNSESPERVVRFVRPASGYAKLARNIGAARARHRLRAERQAALGIHPSSESKVQRLSLIEADALTWSEKPRTGTSFVYWPDGISTIINSGGVSFVYGPGGRSGSAIHSGDIDFINRNDGSSATFIKSGGGIGFINDSTGASGSVLRIGNTTFMNMSDGRNRTCNKIGSMTFCN